MSGVVAGLKRKGIAGVNVVGFAGDGGTVDIGLQALSGAMERGEKFIWICYDNEAYMNTGTQRSGATPYGACTSTTPGGKKGMWEDRPKKDMLGIVMAHGIPYAATACISYPRDYMEKVQKAIEAQGPAYIQVLAPCPSGWGYDTDQTVEMGRLAVQTGFWPLAEYEEGEFRITHRQNRRGRSRSICASRAGSPIWERRRSRPSRPVSRRSGKSTIRCHSGISLPFNCNKDTTCGWCFFNDLNGAAHDVWSVAL